MEIFINQDKTKTLEIPSASGEPASPQTSRRRFPVKLEKALVWAARLALLLGSLGLVVALHLPQRVWQGAAAWFAGRLTQPLETATPFDNLASPNAVFPLAVLALWLQGAATLLWLNSRQTQPEVGPPVPLNMGEFVALPAIIRPILTAVSLLATVVTGLGERMGQLLPDKLDRLPASNYDEMVYFSGSSLLAQGQLPYRDFFLAHPPVSELLYGLLLKLAGLDQGGYQAFLVARWGGIVLGLATIGLLFWVGGRIWSQGKDAQGFAVLPGLAAAWLYALDARAAGIATLEIPANFFTVLGLGVFLEAEMVERRRLQNGLLVGSGLLLALAVLCKLPAAAFVLALVAWLLFRREWRYLLWHLTGLVVGAVAVLGPFLVLSGPVEVLRQIVFFQLLRPDETRAGKDQLGRLADYPDNTLTIFADGLALLFLAVWLVAGGRDRGRWLVPALASFPLVVIFTLSKSFHPWYYVQWALHLALLGGGLFSLSRWQNVFAKITRLFRKSVTPQPSRLLPVGLAVIGVLALFISLPLALAGWSQSQNPAFDRVYRAVGAAISTTGGATGNAPGDVLDFDPGYSFMAGRQPARLPSTGKRLVDGAGYMVYLNLDMDRQSFLALVGKALGGSGRLDTDALFHRERAQALVVEGLAQSGWAVVDGVLALPQLTPQSVEFIGNATIKTATIDYADLYRVRPLAVRQPWTFDNGLVLTPFGLSTSLNGQANADLVEPGEIIRLPAADAGKRSLDLRFVWRVLRPQTDRVKLFVHVVNEAGTVVVQQDLAPQGGRADTAKWQPGDAYQDVHGLPLPGNLPPGSYRVEVGIYKAVGGERITAGGQVSLTLGTIVIS